MVPRRNAAWELEISEDLEEDWLGLHEFDDRCGAVVAVRVVICFYKDGRGFI